MGDVPPGPPKAQPQIPHRVLDTDGLRSWPSGFLAVPAVRNRQTGHARTCRGSHEAVVHPCDLTMAIVVARALQSPFLLLLLFGVGVAIGTGLIHVIVT